MKNIAKKTGKIIVWIFTSIVVLIVLTGTILMIPAVQTYVAQKVAGILSEKMQTEVSIGKLHIDFALNIKMEDLHLNDQHGNNLISAKKGSLSFPSFNTKTANVEIRNIVLEEANVTFRRYDPDSALNLQFFIDFVRPKQQKEKKTVVDLRHIRLKNSRFQLKNDDKAGENKEGVWNYSNMIIENINLKLNQLLIIGDSLNLHIDELSAMERSGFQLDKFSGHLRIFRQGLHCLNTNFVTRNKSKIAVDFRFDYTDYSDFQDFINKIKFNTDLHKSWLNLADLVYFVPSFKGMNNFVHVAATVKGSIADYKIKNLDLSYGQATEIKGNIDLQGLPLINETFIDFSIEKLKTNLTDLVLFVLPKGKTIPLPDIVKKIQSIETQGHFVGLYNNFFADAAFSTALGDASCELMLNFQSLPISYDGKLQTNNLALGTLLSNSDLGNITMNGQITGKGVKVEDMDFRLQSTVSSIAFRNNTVKDIFISGDFLSKQFDGQVVCSDEDFNLKFNGLIDFNQQEVNYNFKAAVYALNLSNFKLFRPDSQVVVSANIDMNITGKDFDHFRGKLSMNKIVYKENTIAYPFPDFSLTIDQPNYPNKNITLKSNILNADLSGRFTYLQAFAAVKQSLHSQLSNLIPCPVIDSTQEIFSQQFNLSFHLKDSIPLLRRFIPIIRISKGLNISLSIDQARKTSSISVEMPQLDINNKHRLMGLSVVNQQNAKTDNLGIICRSYFTNLTRQDSLPDIQNFDFQAVITDNVIDYLATATGNEQNKLSDVLLEGSVKFLDMKKREMEIVLNNGSIVWDNIRFLFDASNYVYLARDSIFIRNFGLHTQDGKSISAQNKTTENEGNNIHFNFNKINLGLLNVFLNQYQISLAGEITGQGRLIRNAYGYALGSNAEVENFHFNDVSVGFLKGRTYWNNIEKKLLMQASLFENQNNLKDSLLTIRGSFDPKEKYINLIGRADSLNVKVLEPYLRSFASRVEGFGTGEVFLKGKLSDPKLTGSIALKKAVLGIDFLKTDYFIEKGSIDFVDTGFIFNNLYCNDGHNGKGTVNGMVTHKRLRNFGVNLKISASNLMVLNTTMKDNTLFYGKAFATGTASILGKVNDVLSISADVVTNPLTDISLSLDGNITVAESDFIRFISPDAHKEKEKSTVPPSQKSTAMEVNLKITATPDAKINVLLDPTTVNGTIVGRGNGTVEMMLDRNNNFNMYGLYTIANGDFDVALYGVLKRNFKIENGGTILWNGSPTQATVNVRGIQATRVSNPLANNENGTRYRLLTINNILSLSGGLLNPNISFSFTLPDADEDTRSSLYNMFDTTNRGEMIRQTVNVLLFGRFETSNQENQGNNQGANAGTNMAVHSLSELVSAQISKFTSAISPNLDVRLDYHSGENTAENEYGVELGARFLNDRLSIRTNFGILEQQDVDAQNRFLGDATIEYDLSNDGSLRAKAFNITNPQDMLSTYTSTYSQGLGLMYSKEFDTAKELFTRKRKDKNKDKTKQPAGTIKEEKEEKTE